MAIRAQNMRELTPPEAEPFIFPSFLRHIEKFLDLQFPIVLQNIVGGAWGSALANTTVTLTNNTISNNTASTEEKGGGICLRLFDHNVIAYIYNNIIWDNEDGGDIYLEGSGTFNGFNNDHHELSGSWTHEGDNIDDDPLFVDPENHDYHLQTGSPCMDTGNNDAPELPEKDKDGNPRIIDGNDDDIAIVDMGAYEFGDVCKGDFNGNKEVDEDDLALFAADFGRTNCSPDNPCKGDFDHDGDVDGSDLAIFAGDFGRIDCPVCR